MIGYYILLEFTDPDSTFLYGVYVFLAALLLYPVVQLIVLALAVILKWIVIGKFKPGKYPLYSFYYWRYVRAFVATGHLCSVFTIARNLCRWWLVTRVYALVPASFIRGSPLLPIYLRLLGAKIGRRVHIQSVYFGCFDLITIGDDSSIGADAHLYAYHVKNGFLEIGPVNIGEKCYVGARSHLEPNSELGDGANLGELSCLAMGRIVPPWKSCSGSPAVRTAHGNLLCADMVIPIQREYGCLNRLFIAVGSFCYGFLFVMAYCVLYVLMFVAFVPGVGLFLLTEQHLSWTTRLVIFIPVQGWVLCLWSPSDDLPDVIQLL